MEPASLDVNGHLQAQYGIDEFDDLVAAGGNPETVEIDRLPIGVRDGPPPILARAHHTLFDNRVYLPPSAIDQRSEDSKHTEVGLHEPGVLNIHVPGVCRPSEAIVRLQGWRQFVPVVTEGSLHQTFHDPIPGMCLNTISVTTSIIEAKAGTPSQNHQCAIRQ